MAQRTAGRSNTSDLSVAMMAFAFMASASSTKCRPTKGCCQTTLRTTAAILDGATLARHAHAAEVLDRQAGDRRTVCGATAKLCRVPRASSLRDLTSDTRYDLWQGVHVGFRRVIVHDAR